MPYLTLHDFRQAIAKLKAGYRPCVCCQEVCIEPTQPSWVIKCKPCYFSKASVRFCSICSDEIPLDRRMYAKRRGGEVKRCYKCSRGVSQPCDECGVIHPAHWHPVPVSA